jgi:hypothetical protein
MLNHAAGSGQHSYEERGQDFYETPVCAVEALLRVESLPHRLWEPACGRGAIVKVLEAHGHKVFATDVVDYGQHEKLDFLSLQHPVTIASYRFCEAIVTNPPYQHAAKFVRQALVLCPYVAMLLRLAFLESEGRSDILDERKPARIHIFKKRLPMMHRSNWQGPKASSAIAFAWYVWDRNHSGPTTIDRI